MGLLLKDEEEYNYTCQIFEVTQGDMFNPEPDRILRHTSKCRVTLKMAEEGSFAAKTDYIMTIPYEEGVTPKIYVDYEVEIPTPNEVITGKVDVTAPLATELGKLKIYIKRETWNTKPIVNNG